MIEIESVTKKFGTKPAINNLTLTVQRGEMFAFLGPNGAGKTTTIKVIVGLLKADAGTVRICGHDITKDALVAKGFLSYVPDQPFLYEKLSGREFLEFVGRMYRMESQHIARRIACLADTFSLGGFLDDLTERYSHGMKQRTVVAAALLHEPKVLVVDEPMVGLDPRSMRVLKDVFREVAKAGTTMFMSTHTLAIAEELADRIGIIHCGNLVALGTLDELQQTAGGECGLEESFLRLTV